MAPQSLPETLCRQFSLAEIKSATNNFSADLIIGKGSFGNVYKAKIAIVPGNPTTVAVKRRNFNSKQGLDEFWTEVKLLSQCRHTHLICLLGYCVDQVANEMILVYEYMANGTLADHIYKNKGNSSYLSWEQRLKICIGVGRGLEYLHAGTGINQMVIHRDLKCSNILLDADWAAKISDFGLCKKCSGDLPYAPIISSVKGTIAYMDPKYLTTHELSTKTDVYAFGVVLLEVLCGRRSLNFEVADRQKRLVLWAEQCIREGVAHRIIDPDLRGSLAKDGLNIFLETAMKCLQDRPKKRPTFADVVGKLEIALASQYSTYSSSSSVDDEFVKHFSQVAYSSSSANSDVDPSSHTIETRSPSPSVIVRQEPGSDSTSASKLRRRTELKSSSENNALEVAVDLPSNHVKPDVSMHSAIATASKTSVRFSSDKDDEYEKLIKRMNPLSVEIDNYSSRYATIIKVNSTNRQGVLLEVVQVLSDLGLIIIKAYMSCDGSWSMNVLHVTDEEGNKITDEGILGYIQTVLDSDTSFSTSMKSAELTSSTGHTVLELVGSDRPGLLSEVCTVLTDLQCNIMNAILWTHNKIAAFIGQLTDAKSGMSITDTRRLDIIEFRLSNVLKVSNDARKAFLVVSHGVFHSERRLHQMMFRECDYERRGNDDLNETRRPDVTVVNWYDKDYSMVTIRCKDRPKLLFDTICTLTDLKYVVFHGHVVVEGPQVYQEFCIRHIDGLTVCSEAERRRLIQCIEAAIERRVSEDLELELCTTNRIGLLSDVTRIFRENGLTITKAEVDTRAGKTLGSFYVGDASGNPVDSKTVESIRSGIGETRLRVKCNPQESPRRFIFDALFKFPFKQSLYNLGLVQSSE